MPRLRFNGFPHTDSYGRTGSPRWFAGDVREVTEAEASYLLSDFGAHFEEVKIPEPRAVVEAPHNRMVVSAPNDRALGPDLSVLDGTVADLRAALESGAHDDDLFALYEAEDDGKARSTALQAIEDRIASHHGG